MIKLFKILDEIKSSGPNLKKELLKDFWENHPQLLEQVTDQLSLGIEMNDNTISDLLDDFGYEDDFTPEITRKIKILGQLLKPNEIWVHVMEEGSGEWINLMNSYKYINIYYVGDGENAICLSNEKF